MARYALIVAVAALLAGPPPQATPGNTPPQAAPDALAIVVHRSNPLSDISARELRRVFLLETQTWPNGRRITVVLREKGQAERAEALRMICGLTEGQYDRHILLQTFRGTIDRGPREILSAAAMLRFVFNVPGAIGYVPAAEADDTVRILRVDGLLPDAPAYALRRGPRGPARSGK